MSAAACSSSSAALAIRGGAATVGAGIYIDYGAQTQIDGVIVQSGAAGQRGGGIYIAANATLALTGSSIFGNTAGHQGGGLFVDYQASATITRCAIYNNRATNAGGGIYTDGALSITNSTISGNACDRHGGGVYSDLGIVSMVNVTVAGNRADANTDGSGQGGGLYSTGTPMLLHNTIVASNIRRSTTPDDVFGPLADASSYNLIGAGADGVTDGQQGSHVGSVATPLDAGLMPLGLYAGPTPTHALTATSIALDAGSDAQATAAGLSVDQTGNLRFRDFDGNGVAEVDIGLMRLHA